MATKEVSLKSKLLAIRLELSKDMNKSGKNKYSNYDYFQLKDFMPRVIELCNEHGVYTKFWIGYKKLELPSESVVKQMFDENGKVTGESKTTQNNFEYKEFAFLEVTNLDNEEEVELYEKETANCSLSGAQAIQNLGGKSTYMKRYMYMDLFEINENDKVEEETGKPTKVESKTTSSKKPAVKKVETKTEVTPADFEPKEEVVEKPVETPTSDLMAVPHKVELATMLKKAGFNAKEGINEICAELGLEVTLIKESDYDAIKAKIEERIGK